MVRHFWSSLRPMHWQNMLKCLTQKQTFVVQNLSSSMCQCNQMLKMVEKELNCDVARFFPLVLTFKYMFYWCLPLSLSLISQPMTWQLKSWSFPCLLCTHMAVTTLRLVCLSCISDQFLRCWYLNFEDLLYPSFLSVLLPPYRRWNRFLPVLRTRLSHLNLHSLIVSRTAWYFGYTSDIFALLFYWDISLLRHRWWKSLGIFLCLLRSWTLFRYRITKLRVLRSYTCI